MAMLNNQTVIFLLDVLWNPGCIAFVDLIHVATMGPLWHHAVCSLPRVPAIDAEAGVLQMIEARGPKYFGTNPEFLQPLYWDSFCLGEHTRKTQSISCAVLGTAGPKAQGQCLRASTQNPGQREWWLNRSCWFRINDCHPQYWKIIRFFKIQPAKVQYLGWLNRTRSDSWNHQMLTSQPTEWWSYLKYLEIFGISYANWRRVQDVSHTNWMQSLVWLSCWTATPHGTSWLVCNQSNLAAADSLMDDRFRELADL